MRFSALFLSLLDQGLEDNINFHKLGFASMIIDGASFEVKPYLPSILIWVPYYFLKKGSGAVWKDILSVPLAGLMTERRQSNT